MTGHGATTRRALCGRAKSQGVVALFDDERFFGPFRSVFDPTEGRPPAPIETYLQVMFEVPLLPRLRTDHHMADHKTVDHELVAVLDELITAIQETKQFVWATTSEHRVVLGELRTFLISQAMVFSEAEERIGGRDPSLVSPTGRPLRNLRAEAGGDDGALLALVIGHLAGIAADVRSRSARVVGATEQQLFDALADGIDDRLHRLSGTSRKL